MQYEFNLEISMGTFGLLIGNRDFFPSKLCEDARQKMLTELEGNGHKVVCLSENDTPFGAIENFSHATKCAELFRRKSEVIDGLIISLPNFGDERSIADSIRLSKLDVPVLVQAFPDKTNDMSVDVRRDSFCGKISVCNSLKQHGINFSLTGKHTVDPDSESFRNDLIWFDRVCKIVNGIRNVRVGVIGTRPDNFSTVRFSEKILEQESISVISIELLNVLDRMNQIASNDRRVTEEIENIESYIKKHNAPGEAVEQMAKFKIVLEELIHENNLAGTAIQCWTALEKYFGFAPCLIMSMLTDHGIPSACETDVTGLLSMYILMLASGNPSAIVDWNNNFNDEDDKGIVFHCSNIPKTLLEDNHCMTCQEILAKSMDKNKTYGAVKGIMKESPLTFLKLSTDDSIGKIKAYLGEGEMIQSSFETFGGYGTIKVNKFQELLQFICNNGYEHHVAVNPALVADSIKEAIVKYLKWELYVH